jgi:pyruvate kinase
MRSEESRRAATKVVATIGPASEGRIHELIEAGLSVARINFSHGVEEDHRRRVKAIREAAEELGTAIGILADIQGPKLRLGRFPEGELVLMQDEVVRLVEGGRAEGEGQIPFDFEGFAASVRAGDRVFLADAAVELVVESNGAGDIVARVRRGGVIGDRKGVHLPDSDLTFEVPTDADREHIELARDMGVDMLGLSFVSHAGEVDHVRSLAPDMSLVAKIERKPALDDLKGILESADGLMVARGDLGVEVPLETLPLVQKQIIKEAKRAGKFTITATEMLESMVKASRPTRAEVNDVAGAVLDGTDAVMLSAETAVGAFPVEAVQAMCRIARAAENSSSYRDLPRVSFRESEPTFSNATALAAVQAAEALDIRSIVCFTESSNTVRLVSRYRPEAEIIALTPSRRTLHAMTILAHVRPMLFQRAKSIEDMLHEAQVLLLEHDLVLPGQEIVFVAGVPPGVSRSTNVMKLHRVGEATRLH